MPTDINNQSNFQHFWNCNCSCCRKYYKSFFFSHFVFLSFPMSPTFICRNLLNVHTGYDFCHFLPNFIILCDLFCDFVVLDQIRFNSVWHMSSILPESFTVTFGCWASGMNGIRKLLFYCGQVFFCTDFSDVNDCDVLSLNWFCGSISKNMSKGDRKG